MRLLPIALLSLSGLTAQPSYPPAFPRPNATRLLDSPRYTVWDIVWPKGQPSPLHRHLYDQVGTYYHSGGRIITTPEGARREATTAVGGLSATRAGTTHVEEGNTDPPLRAVFIELKQGGPSGLGPAAASEPPAFPRDGAKSLRDDERVTVWDYTWTPGTTTAASVHQYEEIWVWLGAGKVRVTPRGGSSTTIDAEPGRIRHVPRGTVEADDGVSGSPRVMIFVLK